MTRHFRLRTAALAAVVALVLSSGSPYLPAAEPAPQPWTLDEAIRQLRLYPRDTYLQYVVLQLGRREGRLEQATSAVAPWQTGPWRGPDGRMGGVDLFSVFSGALAVQESLQLDAMAGDQRRPFPGFPPGKPTNRPTTFPEKPASKLETPMPQAMPPVPEPSRPPLGQEPRKAVRPGEPQVPPPVVREAPRSGPPAPPFPGEFGGPDVPVNIARLSGPTIQSHPWETMLGGRKPEISPLARCVPADFYFVEFGSLARLVELADNGDLWGTHLFSQSQQEAHSQMVGERLKRQLALETTGLLRPFYDAVVDDVAVTGSDLFFREGSDVTVLFRFKNAPVFKAQMEGFLDKAQRSQPAAVRSAGQCLGVPYDHVTSPDRAVHVFSAYPQADLHVRSNSLAALERVLAAVRGEDAQGRPVQRLGDTAEFAYIRTLMPRGAAEENGFIYLSDPFIRRMVGPQVKLTARRRMLCYNHLRMIGHASLLYRTEHGRAPASLQELDAARCSPGEFGTGRLACPDGGRYTLSPDGSGGTCSHHGRPQSLVPCCEIPLSQVTGAEAMAYQQFVQEYNQYWRTFFDPIAIRVQAAPKRYRVETIVLPLIDNSIYTGLARSLGGPVEPLDRLPVPKRNVFSLAVRVNKAELERQLGQSPPPPTPVEEAGVVSKPERKEAGASKPWSNTGIPPAQLEAEAASRKLKELAFGWDNYHDRYLCLPSSAPVGPRAGATAQTTGLSWRVRILPFIGQGDLYAKFRLAEPWDSEHNRKLVAEMPAVYRPADEKLASAGKTRFVTPRGEKTISPAGPQPMAFQDVRDGTSNTIMLVEADDEHAVVWTKPDDLEIDLQKPAAGLFVRPPGGFLMAFADGSVRFPRRTVAVEKLAAGFTRAGGEGVHLDQEAGPGGELLPLRVDYGAPPDLSGSPGPGRTGPTSRRAMGPFGLPEDVVTRLNLGELLSKGIGDSVGLHVYDSEPMFDFSLPSFLGQSLGTFQGGRGPMGNEALLVGLLISALNSPVYVSAPVRDAAVVDAFLVRLDQCLGEMARQRGGIGFFSVDQDYYQVPLGGAAARSYGFRFGPVKWRFFWARIGDGLYVASQPFILEDLAAMQGDAAKPAGASETAGHGMVRIRPQNWQRVLPGYQLGWAENNRAACLHNVGPLSSLARAYAPLTAGKPPERIHAGLVLLGERIYGARFFCPDGGKYQIAPDGKSVVCTLHGSATAPRQQTAPAADSEIGRLLRDFADMTLTLTFLEDGLHAVAIIDRR